MHFSVEKVHRKVMVKTVNPSQSRMNIFIVYRIGSRKSKNEGSVYNQDYVLEKLSSFRYPQEIHQRRKPIYENEKIIQEEIK